MKGVKAKPLAPESRLSLEHSQRFSIYKQPPFKLLMDEPSLSRRSSCGLVEPCCLSHSILEFHNRSDTITLALPHCHCTHARTHAVLTLFLPGWALTKGRRDIFKVEHSNPVPLTHDSDSANERKSHERLFQEQHATVTGIVPSKTTPTL